MLLFFFFEKENTTEYSENGPGGSNERAFDGTSLFDSFIKKEKSEGIAEKLN